MTWGKMWDNIPAQEEIEMKKEVYEVSEFGKLVRDTRKRQGVTQVALAAIANVGPRFIGDLERGKKTIELGKALHVAYLLGIKIEMNTDE